MLGTVLGLGDMEMVGLTSATERSLILQGSCPRKQF